MLKKKTIATPILSACLWTCFTSGVFAQPGLDELVKVFHYRSIGPTRQSGRIVDFAVPLQQPYTFYVAAANGGLWKTINNGTTFFPIFDTQSVIAIGDIAVAPSEPDILWVGTGEPNNSSTDPYASYWGDGVYKSLDGGQTWENMGLPESHQIGRIVVHPQNPDIVYVAAVGHLYSDNPERGVFKTTDGGKTWQHVLKVTYEDRHAGAIDLAMNPKNPAVLYAAAYDRHGTPWMFFEGGEGGGIYKTTDAGSSWTKLENGLPKGLIGRIGLAISPQNPEILYASIHTGESFEQRFENHIYCSDDAGLSWRETTNNGAAVNGGSYFGQIRVDPNDLEHVFVLSFGNYHSKDGGKTWSKAFRWGGDNHALWINPRDSRHILLGYDYGLAWTYDGGENWYHPDELPLAQLYGIGVDMAYPYNVYGGMQDFGTWKGPSTKKGRFPIRFEDWEHMAGGDGYYCQVDPVNNRWLYAESQNGNLLRIDMKTGKRRNIQYRGNPDIRFNFNAPILISPHNSNIIFHGANIVLRSENQGASWREISPDLTTNNPELRNIGPLAYCTITTLDESPVQQGVLWVGTDDGVIQVSRDSGENWAKVSANIPDNPGYWVSRVTASHHDPGTAYVTYSGRRWDDFRPFIYKTTDFGATWKSVAGNLPDEPINVIKEDRKNTGLLFVGTEKSIWVTLDGGLNWARMQNNMPTQGVHDLILHPRENDLVVGTHGRGFFITDISPLQELTREVLRKDVHLFEIEPKVQWVMPSQPATSAQNFAGDNEPHGVAVNYYLKRKAKDIKIEIYQGSVKINEIAGPGEAGLNQVRWYMTKRRRRTAEEVAQLERLLKGLKGEEDFYDFYDTVDFYLNPDDEVNALGQSLHTRVQNPGPFEKEWFYQRVQPGTYTVKLLVDDRVFTHKSVILQDYWYDK